jgi:hypothetical protein
MKKVFVGIALVLSMSMVSGCVIEASTDYCWDNGTCTSGASCDYVDDQDCRDRTSAWWCDTFGVIRINDCIAQCTGLAPYACCGYDPTRRDDACLCCMSADCSGLACEF